MFTLQNNSVQPLKKVGSVSGGKTSAYMQANYSTDIVIFSLVRMESSLHLWNHGKDEKTRQQVSDRLGYEFIATAEYDDIIYTILDLEQFIGQQIHFVSGMSWEELIVDRKGFLPSYNRRFCTTELKIEPIFHFLNDNGHLPCVTNIGYRKGEERRKNNMEKRYAPDGFIHYYKRLDLKPNSTYYNRALIKYQRCEFPLIETQTDSAQINAFWKDKPVRFADYNNCGFCVNREALFLSYLSRHNPYEYSKGIYLEKFANKVAIENEKSQTAHFRPEGSLQKISEFNPQQELFQSDFNSCDSGHCGI